MCAWHTGSTFQQKQKVLKEKYSMKIRFRKIGARAKLFFLCVCVASTQHDARPHECACVREFLRILEN